jgi:potassium-transporting ATPase KdpC subunit
MRKEIIPSLLLTVCCIIVFSGLYPLLMLGIAKGAVNSGDGFMVRTPDGKSYYENIAQSFTKDDYFWPRPSAVNYNANGSGGSNKGPAEPSFLQQVSDRIDTFMAHDPGVKRADIPVDMVTASGSGLDPDISVQGALVQAVRVAKARNISPDIIEKLVRLHIEPPVMGMGPERVNVLKLNIALDQLK